MSLAHNAPQAVPNDLEAYWLPFTPNRAFKKAPRLIARAKDMHYYTPEWGAHLADELEPVSYTHLTLPTTPYV